MSFFTDHHDILERSFIAMPLILSQNQDNKLSDSKSISCGMWDSTFSNISTDCNNEVNETATIVLMITYNNVITSSLTGMFVHIYKGSHTSTHCTYYLIYLNWRMTNSFT